MAGRRGILTHGAFFFEAHFLRDPDQVAALFLLPGIASGETKPGPAGAEAGRAAAAGDPFAAAPAARFQSTPGDEWQLESWWSSISHLRLCASPGVPRQTGRPGRLPQLV